MERPENKGHMDGIMHLKYQFATKTKWKYNVVKNGKKECTEEEQIEKVKIE